jgi:hypothetical protein
MKIIIIAALGVIMAIAIYTRRNRATPQIVGPRSGELADIIEWARIEAPKDAKENHGIILDFSDESVARVEKILGKLYKPNIDKNNLPGGTRGMAILYGVYIGECIIKNHKGLRWELNHEAGGNGSMPVILPDGASFPVGWCLKRLVNGEEDNVWHKYQVTIINRGKDSIKQDSTNH